MSIFPSTILLATDGSKDAWLATNTAIGLAMVTGSELHVVNVGVVAPTLLKTLDVGPARVEQEARRILAEEVKSIEKVGGTVARSHLRMGDAAQEIVNLAEELKAGLIAVGSRGRGRIKRALIGSVSDSVVRYAHCPVLVARWKPLIFPAQILVATDGSEEATLAAKTAAELAHRTYSELHLVSVADAYSSYYYVQQTGLGDDLPQRAQDVLDDQVKKIERSGREVAGKHVRASRRHPADEIVRVAEEIGTDLVVMGSRGRGRIERALMGSVSDSVVRHAHCPVLAVRKDRTQTQPLSGEASPGAGRERSNLSTSRASTTMRKRETLTYKSAEIMVNSGDVDRAASGEEAASRGGAGYLEGKEG
jgi:nucleotide-binding universal stress UspA family protein